MASLGQNELSRDTATLSVNEMYRDLTSPQGPWIVGSYNSGTRRHTLLYYHKLILIKKLFSEIIQFCLFPMPYGDMVMLYCNEFFYIFIIFAILVQESGKISFTWTSYLRNTPKSDGKDSYIKILSNLCPFIPSLVWPAQMMPEYYRYNLGLSAH